MNLDIGGIAERTIEIGIRGWPRIIRSKHRAHPTDTGYGSSRFSSPAKTYRVLYAGDSFRTSFAEAVVRDRFVGKTRKYLYEPFLKEKLVTELATSADLRLLDFTGDAAHELGIDTDAKGAKSHEKGQEFGEALYAHTVLDGLIFDSRMTGRRCIAIFDRAFGNLVPTSPEEMMSLSAFWDEIDRRKIIIRRQRGI